MAAVTFLASLGGGGYSHPAVRGRDALHVIITLVCGTLFFTRSMGFRSDPVYTRLIYSRPSRIASTQTRLDGAAVASLAGVYYSVLHCVWRTGDSLSAD